MAGPSDGSQPRCSRRTLQEPDRRPEGDQSWGPERLWTRKLANQVNPALTKFLSSGKRCEAVIFAPEALLSREELKDRAFQAIKRREGCSDVSDVTIYEINDAAAAQSNWGIGAIGIRPGSASAANRAAVLVEHELRNSFDLLAAL